MTGIYGQISNFRASWHRQSGVLMTCLQALHTSPVQMQLVHPTGFEPVTSAFGGIIASSAD